MQAQFIPNLIFSGVLDRFPKLKWVCAETGVGWVNYVLEACDHEWERRHLRYAPGDAHWLSEGIACPLCQSFWFGLLIALFLPHRSKRQYLINALGLSGAATFLYKVER